MSLRLFNKLWIHSHAISISTLATHYILDKKQLEAQYKNHLSDYHSWNQKEQADDWVLYPENVDPRLSLDETTLSKSELYTIITSKSAKGKKGTLVAMIKEIKVKVVKSIILKHL